MPSPYGAANDWVVGDDFPQIDDTSNPDATISGGSEVVLQDPSKDPRALTSTDSSLNISRVMAYYGSSTQITLTLDLQDTNIHELALYACDYEHYGRATVSFYNYDPTTNKIGSLLGQQAMLNFQKGRYLLWDIHGPVAVEITNMPNTGPSCVLSGIFTD